MESLYKDKELLSISPILGELENALNNTKPRPNSPLYAQISDVLQTQLSSILTNQSTVEKSMNLAAIKTKRIISSSGKEK